MTTFAEVTTYLSKLQTERESYRNTLIKLRRMLGITDTSVLTETVLQKVLDQNAAISGTGVPVVPGAGGTVVTPGGFAGASTTVDPYWKKVFEDDFPILAAEGKFLTTYGKWNAYPNYYLTTAGQKVVGRDSTGKDILQGDHYETANLSVRDVDGLRVLNCQLRPRQLTPDNKNWGAAPYPRFDIGLGEARARNMKVEMRVRIPNPTPGWHPANLMWFDDQPWPGSGENDFWEQNTPGTIGAFFHNVGASAGNDQRHFSSNITPDAWHTIGVEFIGGKSYKQFIDGKQIKPDDGGDDAAGTILHRVPTGIARLVLQNEPDGAPTAPMDVQYDWVRCWSA